VRMGPSVQSRLAAPLKFLTVLLKSLLTLNKGNWTGWRRSGPVLADSTVPQHKDTSRCKWYNPQVAVGQTWQSALRPLEHPEPYMCLLL
jgi:hypothetical protein